MHRAICFEGDVQVVPWDFRIRRILLPAEQNGGLAALAIWGDRERREEERLHTSDDADLGNTVRVTENDTDLRGGDTLPGQFADLLLDLGGGGLEPRRHRAGVGDGRVGDTLSVRVKTTHFGGL